MTTESWPHAPAHWTFEPGIYMVTAGVYRKRPLLNTPSRRDMVLKTMFDSAEEFGWKLQAWAVMRNHYHFVANTEAPETLSKFMRKFHANTARELNKEDGTPKRRVWYQFWDTHINYERSWLARLNYVHNNPVHHGVTGDADSYRWCSSAWFAQTSSKSFVKTVKGFKTDRVTVIDDF